MESSPTQDLCSHIAREIEDMLPNLAQIPENMTVSWLDNPAGLKQLVADLRSALLLPPVPPIDQWFHLAVDHNADLKDIVPYRRRKDWEEWKYCGPSRSGVEVCRVKLVKLGPVKDLDEAKRKAREINGKYRLLEGKAVKAFTSQYKITNRRDIGPMVFGGSEWEHLSGQRAVTYSSTGGSPRGQPTAELHILDDKFYEQWEWAVCCEEG